MSKAVVPGSFDPVTKGHLDIITRSAGVFDVTCDIPNVKVDSFSGLLVDYMSKVGAHVIVKGLRAVSDFEYEYQMALTNRKLNPDVETFFLNTSQEFMYLSSSVVKQIALFGGDVSDFLPEPIQDDVQNRLRKG